MILTAATVLPGDHSHSPGWVEVDRGVVVGVGSGAPPRPADLALGDAVLTPGFVDMHVHGGGGGAYFEATEEAVTASVTLHRRFGTTSTIASLVSDHHDVVHGTYYAIEQRLSPMHRQAKSLTALHRQPRCDLLECLSRSQQGRR